MKNIILISLAFLLGSVVFSDEPTVEEINYATELFEKAGEQFSEAQTLFDGANTVLSRVDEDEDVSLEKIESASADFEEASRIFAQAESNYTEANEIFGVTEEPATEEYSEEEYVEEEYVEDDSGEDYSSTGYSLAGLGRIMLHATYYGLNEYSMKEEDRQMLQVLLMDIPDPSKVTFYLEGHTCSTFTRYHNKILSIKRSRSIRDYLMKMGVPKENIIVKGYGEDNPVASNKTEEGKAQNRRVEIYVEAK